MSIILASTVAASFASTLAASCAGRAPITPGPSVGVGEGEGEGAVGEGEGEGEGEGAPAFPACASVTGTAAVTFTRDEGATLAPTDQVLTGTQYTFGLAALDSQRLVAESGGTFLASDDAGCSWHAIGAAPTTPMMLLATKGHVFAWADNGTELVRIDGDTITPLTPPGSALHGFFADGDHVVVGADAQLFHSEDAGASFGRQGAPAVSGDPSSLLLYRTAFDPKDAQHAILGTASTGAFVTFDGGATWTQATGTSTGNSNVFTAVISPADANVVYAEGIDLVENLANAPNEGRHLWRSDDGGLTFTAVAEQTADVTLINGPTIAAHPTNADVVYFVFGTYFQSYGTDLYKYDHATGAVTKTHNHYDDVSSIVFSPADARVMYLGLTSEAID